jgi:hypothetical protein
MVHERRSCWTDAFSVCAIAHNCLRASYEIARTEQKYQIPLHTPLIEIRVWILRRAHLCGVSWSHHHSRATSYVAM